MSVGQNASRALTPLNATLTGDDPFTPETVLRTDGKAAMSQSQRKEASDDPVKFYVRLDRGFHQRCVDRARSEGMSLASYIRWALVEALQDPPIDEPPADWEPTKRAPLRELRVQLDEDIARRIAFAAERMGIPVSAYVLNAALHYEPPEPLIARDEADRLWKELSAQGRNLNQVAIRVNQEIVDDETRAMFERLHEQYGKLFDQVMRLMSRAG